MRVILLGGPGAGKGTQANFIKRRYNIPQISTGDMLRAQGQAGGDFGERVKKIMDSGGLVPDDMIMDMVTARIAASDCAHGFLLDGFPRTLAQARSLKSAAVAINAVVEIHVPDDEIIKRMSGRRVHPASGRSYHVIYNPPKRDGKDDETGEDLIQRDDDKEQTVSERLRVYHEQTKPLIGFFMSEAASGDATAPLYLKINGVGAVEAIRDRVFAALDTVAAARNGGKNVGKSDGGNGGDNSGENNAHRAN